MTARSWGELGRFSILLVLCGLLLSVPAILLRPIVAASQLDRDTAVIATMSVAPPRGEAKRGSDPTVRAIYRLNDGSSVVFVKARLYRDDVELAVGMTKEGNLFDLRNTNEMLPPLSARPALLRRLALSDDVRTKFMNSTFQAQPVDGLSGASFDLRRYFTALRAAAAAAREVK